MGEYERPQAKLGVVLIAIGVTVGISLNYLTLTGAIGAGWSETAAGIMTGAATLGLWVIYESHTGQRIIRGSKQRLSMDS